MIKEHIKKKLIITTFAIFIFLITMSFPRTEEEIKNVTISYQSGELSPIYLLDSSSYVSRINMVIKGDSDISFAKEMLEILTIGHAKSAYIPTLFEPIIPKDTKILSIDSQDNILKVNFSKEFLNIPKGYEEKLIECIVFSLTENDNFIGVMLFVEGKLLEKVPNTNVSLPPMLTREIGANKVYNLESFKNAVKTTIYYVAKQGDYSYYVPVTFFDNNDKNKIEIIIERLKSLPSEKTNLMSYLNASTELSHYEILEQEVLLSFSPLLYEGLHSSNILEEVKYSISLSIQDTLNVKDVIFVEN